MTPKGKALDRAKGRKKDSGSWDRQVDKAEKHLKEYYKAQPKTTYKHTSSPSRTKLPKWSSYNK